ncbi:MAG: TldD/PmbA family protein [Methanoregula sp.]
MDWIETLLKEGSKKVDELEVYYVNGISISASLKQKKISIATSSEDCGLCIRTIHQGRIGASYTNNPDQWKACLDAAVASGNLATPQTWNGLPEPSSVPAVDLSFDPKLKLEPGIAQQFLETMLESAAAHPADVTSGSADLSSGDLTFANSQGIFYTHRSSGVSVSLEAISGQSTGYEFDHAAFIDDIDPGKVGERATFFASRSAGGADIPTGDYDIILSPLAYAELLSNVFVPALSGRNVNMGRSKLAEASGTMVTAPGIDMYDNPHIPREGGSAWWDAEGTPTRRVDFIRDGMLEAFAYDLKTAYRFGKISTGSAVRGGFAGLPSIGHYNFTVDGKRENIADERAIYVHSVVGAHTANPMSGDFSVELSNPFWMEDGDFQDPIKSAMLSGNVFEIHKNIVGLSKESRSIGSYILPSIKINKLHIIGK